MFGYFLNSFSKYEAVAEPPILKGVDLSPYLTEPFTSDLPCHTQSVERMVKLTTEVSKAVCDRVNQCDRTLSCYPRKWDHAHLWIFKESECKFLQP